MTAGGGLVLFDGGTPTLVLLLLGAVLLVLTGASAVRVVGSGHRAVVIRLGQACRVGGPGLVMNVPGLERVRVVSMSPTSIGVPFRGSTREGVRVSLMIEARYQIVDPVVAVETQPDTATRLIDDLDRITNYWVASATLPQLLFSREVLAARVQVTAARRATTCGVRVLDVQITMAEVELNREVLRWM
jgi:regulator of protease activity HflC (stomatin/prohibitin superfamily)